MAVSAKLPPTVRYAEAEYWESRYQREPAVFEWFFGYTALRRIIRAYVSKKKPVLHVGCGTSNLQEGMAQSGYTIVNTDISKVVIKQMKERHAKYINMTYQVSDCRDMPEFMDCQFGSVMDKGTIDALLCCKQGTENVMRMLLEVHRVLQPGGTFLLVTLGDPSRRLPLLMDSRLSWKVSLLLLPKISAACQAYVDGKPINDTVRPIDADGPYEVLDPETIVGIPPGVQYSNFFFTYVCKKQPLQLPLAQGQRAQLPNGWVTGSKELFQKLQKELGLPEDLLAKGRRKRVMSVPAGSSTGLVGMGAAANAQHAGSSAVSSNGASTTPNGQHQQDRQPVQQSVNPMLPNQLDQVQRQRQQQAELVAKLEQLLHQNMQEQLPQHQQTVTGIDAQEVPARPASAPNLPELERAAASGDVADRHCSTVGGSVQSLSVTATSRSSVVPGSSSERLATIGQELAPAASAEAWPYNAVDGSSGASSVFRAKAEDGGAVSPAAQYAEGDVDVQQTIELRQRPLSTPVGSVAAVSAWGLFSTQPDTSGMGMDRTPVNSMCSAPGTSNAAGSEMLVYSVQGRPSPAEAAAIVAGESPGTTLIPMMPRASSAAGFRSPGLRRFSTETPAIPFSAFSPQLALLRKQQLQHSERAADGMVLHDVVAHEAYGGVAAAAAVAAAMSWGRVRPPRCRRLSAVSNTSFMSSTSLTVTAEDELSEMTDEYASPYTTGESQLIREQAEEVDAQDVQDAAESNPSAIDSPGVAMQGVAAVGDATAGLAGTLQGKYSTPSAGQQRSPFNDRCSCASTKQETTGIAGAVDSWPEHHISAHKPGSSQQQLVDTTGGHIPAGQDRQQGQSKKEQQHQPCGADAGTQLLTSDVSCEERQKAEMSQQQQAAQNVLPVC